MASDHHCHLRSQLSTVTVLNNKSKNKLRIINYKIYLWQNYHVIIIIIIFQTKAVFIFNSKFFILIPPSTTRDICYYLWFVIYSLYFVFDITNFLFVVIIFLYINYFMIFDVCYIFAPVSHKAVFSCSFTVILLTENWRWKQICVTVCGSWIPDTVICWDLKLHLDAIQWVIKYYSFLLSCYYCFGSTLWGKKNCTVLFLP